LTAARWLGGGSRRDPTPAQPKKPYRKSPLMCTDSPPALVLSECGYVGVQHEAKAVAATSEVILDDGKNDKRQRAAETVSKTVPTAGDWSVDWMRVKQEMVQARHPDCGMSDLAYRVRHPAPNAAQLTDQGTQAQHERGVYAPPVADLTQQEEKPEVFEVEQAEPLPQRERTPEYEERERVPFVIGEEEPLEAGGASA
jgi:hypothetical protein